jgi:hypothetical protein
MKKKLLVYFLLEIFIIAAFFPIIIFAQTVQSNCVITKVGVPDPNKKPKLPPGCEQPNTPGAPINGTIPPPNMECLPNGYCQLPESTDGSYVFEANTPPDERWGTRELVSVVYTVAQEWRRIYPQGKLYIGDLTARFGHSSHKSGIDLDMDATTDGTRWAADFSDWSIYDRDATVKLGKMFANTGMIQYIFYNDPEANERVLDYTPGENPSKGMDMFWVENHHHHFHVRLNVEELCRVGPYYC